MFVDILPFSKGNALEDVESTKHPSDEKPEGSDDIDVEVEVAGEAVVVEVELLPIETVTAAERVEVLVAMTVEVDARLLDELTELVGGNALLLVLELELREVEDDEEEVEEVEEDEEVEGVEEVDEEEEDEETVEVELVVVDPTVDDVRTTSLAPLTREFSIATPRVLLR